MALGIYLQDYDPSRDEAYVKHINLGGKYCILEFIDTNNYEASLAIRGQWIYKSDATLLVYSTSSRESFDQLEAIWRTIKGVKTQIGMWEPFQLCVVANKCDLEEEREVSVEEGKEFARRIGCAFEECSAKTSENVEKVAYDLVRKIKTYRDNERIRWEQLQEKAQLERERK